MGLGRLGVGAEGIRRLKDAAPIGGKDAAAPRLLGSIRNSAVGVLLSESRSDTRCEWDRDTRSEP